MNVLHPPRIEMKKRVFVGPTIFAFLLPVLFFALAQNGNAQKKCGAEGQRPCKVWERIPSCNKGLTEDFGLNMCTKANTQVDARTGKYIPRENTKMTVASLCNRSSRPMIDIVTAQYTDAEYGWVTSGWIRVAAGRCEKVNIGEGYSGAIYVYAKAADGTEWNNGEAQFCIKPYEKFEFPNADSLQCPTRDFAVVNMDKHDVKPGNNTVNFGN